MASAELSRRVEQIVGYLSQGRSPALNVSPEGATKSVSPACDTSTAMALRFDIVYTPLGGAAPLRAWATITSS